jgi:uncharacterized protein
LIAASAAFGQDVGQSSGRVNDRAGVISAEYRSKIDALINDVESKTSAEIAVVTVQSTAPYDEKQYARAIFDSWKIGKKGKDNGLLVLVAVKDKRWRIETGYGLEGILPDGRCGEIGRNYMVPSFRQGNYGKGVYFALSAMSEEIAKDAGVTLGATASLPNIAPSDELDPNFFLYLFIPVFFFVWNLPWPVFVGLPFTLLFALVFYGISPVFGYITVASYIVSQIFRFFYWSKLPPRKRKSFFGPQNYGGTFTTGGWGSGGRGWGGGGGFGGGGFGGGGGGGGGAGGGW